MTRVIVLGGTGMLGAMVTDVMARDEALTVISTARDEAIAARCRKSSSRVEWVVFDAADFGSDGLASIVDGAEWVINAIGITKPLIHESNPAEVERAIRINSLFPHRLARQAERSGTRVIQIATDCVFSGIRGSYSEEVPHDALDVYGKTKSLGEVRSMATHHLRCSIVGPEPKDYKFLVEWFRRQPPGAKVNGYVNHEWNGITTLHFAKICMGIIKHQLGLPHVQHAVPSGRVTKAELLRLFAGAYNRHDISITDVMAPTAVNAVLCTNQEVVNRQVWVAAGYEGPPRIQDLIVELAGYEFSLSHFWGELR